MLLEKYNLDSWTVSSNLLEFVHGELAQTQNYIPLAFVLAWCYNLPKVDKVFTFGVYYINQWSAS